MSVCSPVRSRVLSSPGATPAARLGGGGPRRPPHESVGKRLSREEEVHLRFVQMSARVDGGVPRAGIRRTRLCPRDAPESRAPSLERRGIVFALAHLKHRLRVQPAGPAQPDRHCSTGRSVTGASSDQGSGTRPQVTLAPTRGPGPPHSEPVPEYGSRNALARCHPQTSRRCARQRAPLWSSPVESPSVHNTQPWISRTTPYGVDLLADESRHLAASGLAAHRRGAQRALAARHPHRALRGAHEPGDRAGRDPFRPPARSPGWVGSATSPRAPGLGGTRPEPSRAHRPTAGR